MSLLKATFLNLSHLSVLETTSLLKATLSRHLYGECKPEYCVCRDLLVRLGRDLQGGAERVPDPGAGGGRILRRGGPRHPDPHGDHHPGHQVSRPGPPGPDPTRGSGAGRAAVWGSGSCAG